MTTITAVVVQNDHDVERAGNPVASRQQSGPLVIRLMTTLRLKLSLRHIKSNLSLTQATKFSIGALVGVLGLISAWWALDLAMWTSVKDFRDDCRLQLQGFNVTTPACEEALSLPLQKPPTWRGYLEKATCSLVGKTKCYEYGGRVHESKRWLASGSARRYEIIHHEDGWESVWDQFDLEDVAMESVRRQSDASIMYGGMPSLTLSWNATFSFPLDRAEQQERYGKWEWQQWLDVTYPCRTWTNTTVTGTVQNLELHGVPDQYSRPIAFEEALALMPPDRQDQWRQDCTFHLMPDDLPWTRLESVKPWHHNVDFPIVLATTFFSVVMGHEVIYGGFARKTRWKWQ